MKNYFLLAFTAFSIISCSNNKNRILHESVSAFLSDNPHVVAFGKLDAEQLLTKADYTSIPKVGLVAKNYLNELKASLNLNAGVYYALKLNDSIGAIQQQSPCMYAFFEVKNADSLKLKLSQQGFEIEKSNDISYFKSANLCLGFRNKLGVVISQEGEFDSKALLEEAFKQTTGDLSSDKVNAQLTRKDDIFFSVNVENLQGLTPINGISKEKKEQDLALIKDTYLATSINVENDAIVIRSANLFSAELKQKVFLASDPQASIRSQLGSGEPTMAISANFDVVKFDNYLNEITPLISQLMERSGGRKTPLFLLSSNKSGISGILSGKIGFASFNHFSSPDEKPDVKGFVGLGKKGAPIANLAKMFISDKIAVVTTSKTGIFASTNAANTANGRLSVPAWFPNFGKKGITGYINMEAFDPALFKDEAEMLKLIKYITFEADENEFVIVIKAKKGKENLLKQAVDFGVQKFMLGQGIMLNS